MSSTTIVPVYHYIGQLYASTSSTKHVHCVLHLVRCFYICDAVVV